jgi:hypothetical protein
MQQHFCNKIAHVPEIYLELYKTVPFMEFRSLCFDESLSVLLRKSYSLGVYYIVDRHAVSPL